jgi:protocatechuate 3,4-dioxygenase beta subunit
MAVDPSDAMRNVWKLAVASFALGCSLSSSAQEDEERIAGDRGLPISASAPSFMPRHLTGPHAGETACPLCVYGLIPQVQVWVQEAHLGKGLALAQRAERLCAEKRSAEDDEPEPVAYVIVVPAAGSELSGETLETVRTTSFEHVFIVTVPAWDDAETSGLYGHSEEDRPDVRVYSIVNRRVFRRWDSPEVESWDEIARALAESAAFVATHEITDSQIAPPWEPGERLEVELRVVDAQDRPLSGIKVSAMQTDVDGHYNPPGWNRREPRLAALAWSDADGKITFRTIVPGAYPSLTEPAHIHFKALVDGRPRWRTLWFEGDPLLTAERRQWADEDEETLVVPLTRAHGIARASHTFVIPD